MAYLCTGQCSHHQVHSWNVRQFKTVILKSTKVNSEVRLELTTLYFFVFWGQEKKGPDSKVLLADLFLEKATWPFPLASSASWLFLKKAKRTNNHLWKMQSWIVFGTCVLQYIFSFKLLWLDSTESDGRLNEKQTKENRAPSQWSKSKGIISYIFFGSADQTTRTDQREHIYISLLYLLTWESCQPPWRVN